MAKQKSGETNLPLIVALVFFVLATIGLGVFCYMLYSEQAGKDEAVKKATSDLTTARTAAKDAEMKARVYRKYLGVEEGDDASVLAAEAKAGDAATSELQRINAAVAKKAGVDPANVPAEWAFWKVDGGKMDAPPGRGLVDLAVDAAQKRDAAQKQADADRQAYAGARAAMQKVTQEYEKFRDLFKGEADKFGSKLDDEIKKAAATFDKRGTGYSSDAAKDRGEIDKLTDTIAKMGLESKRKDEKIKNLETELAAAVQKSRKEDPFQFDEPQGKIIRRHADNTVDIDLGSAALVREGLTFTILPNDFPEKGRSSRIFNVRQPDDRGVYKNVTRFVPKASIEVIQVLGPNLSKARIVQGSEYDDIRDRVMTGDLLYNSIWRKGSADHVALVGIFDTNGDGTDDIETVVRDLRQMGIPVDAYFNFRTMKWEGKLTERTRYIVEGYTPVNTAADPNRDAKTRVIGAMSTAIGEGKQKGVSVISFREFFPRMGYKVKLDVSTDKVNQATSKYLGVTTAEGMPPDGGN